MPSTKQQVTEKITWFVWRRRKKLVLNSDPLRASSIPGLPTSRTTTGRSLDLTEHQFPAVKSFVHSGPCLTFLFTLQALWGTDCHSPQVWRTAFFFFKQLPNVPHESVSPKDLRKVPGNTTEQVCCSPVLAAAFGCRFKF